MPARAVFVGLSTVDLIYTVDDVPARNRKLSIAGQQLASGGPACNAAITFAFLGGASALITAVGRHPLASVIRDELARHSVMVHDIAAKAASPPPVSSILVMRDTGERSVVSANAAAFPELTRGFDPAWLEGASLLLVDGHFMELCIAAAELARRRDMAVVLDSGSWKPRIGALLPFVTVAICSDDFRPPGCRDLEDARQYLRAAGIPQVAITRGAAPIRYDDRGTSGEIPVEQVRAVDTLAAGDIFHGAFCYRYVQQASFTEALAFAARVATFSCRYSGPRRWMEHFRR